MTSFQWMLAMFFLVDHGSLIERLIMMEKRMPTLSKRMVTFIIQLVVQGDPQHVGSSVMMVGAKEFLDTLKEEGVVGFF